MTPLEISIQVLSIVASFAAGAWTGSSRCHLAIEVDTAEHRKDSWLDRVFPCRPRLPSSASWKTSHSEPTTSP
jgi:hypothetical protein